MSSDTRLIDEFLSGLADRLTEHYRHPDCAGHDTPHIMRMLMKEGDIRKVVDYFDHQEWIAAVWLHNLDRAPNLQSIIGTNGLEKAVMAFLNDSPFTQDAIARVADAVAQHSKRDDEPRDSPLLTALRIADKLDRLGPIGALTAAMIHGPKMPIYEPDDPFGMISTEEGRLKSIYNDLFRLLEWVDMLPSDAARSLINRVDLLALINFVRALAAQISIMHQEENPVEAQIQKALGRHYETFALPH